ncbi:transglycosylase family protein [Streptomyces albipurpureus]|uniref:Transglycosylase family protein n=1 Tax=Streptomyces albipurpureus TaxID=2897419 RepID=A0ABT0UNN7_9ACTN|nr:transglycosylase family protein [Streptomyces sp. CWNU-1]MCM2390223.1 transglycosylase family protein [Streptomyces sp. CWNU-1]
MLFSSKGKHRRPSKTSRIVALAGVTGVAVAAPLMGATSANAATSAEWDKVAQCESGGNWSINTGNGYYGGLQFSASTWAAFGGTKYASTANQASKSQQIEIAEKVLAGQGKGAWPSCGVGLSNAAYGGGNAESQQQQPKQEKPKAQPKQQQPKAQQKQAKPQQRAEVPTTRSERAEAPVAKVKGFQKGDGEYQVKAGDTLSKIANAEQVDGGWKKLFELNEDVVSDADVIYPGQQLHLR